MRNLRYITICQRHVARVFRAMVFFWLLFAAGAQAQPTAGAPGNRGALIANGIFGQKNVLLVTRSVFVEPLTEWIQYRRSQGWNVELLLAENRNSPDAMMMPEEIRARIRAKARAGSVDAIFIVGDGAAVTEDGPFGRRRVVPAPRVEPEVIQRFGEDESIASDSWYADFDDDAIPDAAIGRLPARTTGDVVGNVRKIIRYETGIPAGVWQRQVNFVTGVGGFSPLLDTIIQRSVRHLLSELLPGGISLTLTQADWKSVYCPDPKLFRFTVIDQINEGSLFWIYMGHGFYDTLDYLQTPEGELRIMESGDAAAVDVRGGVPILLFFACYTGAYDATVPSLAEELALRPNGPAAVVAASRTSMPYGMASLGTELLGQVFPPDGSRVDRTLGEILLAAKRNLVLAGGKQNQPAGGTGEDDAAESNAEEETAKVNQTEEAAGDEAAQDGDSSITSIRRRLDSMALMFNPAADNLAGERRDHLNLFNLLGDPLLRVRLPETFALEADKAVDAGGRLTVSARGVTASGAPANGSVRVELALPADRQALHQVRKEFSLDDRARIEFQRTFEKANRQVLSYTDGTVVNGQFSLELAIPEDLAGEMSLRAVVLDPKTTLIGSRPIHIRWVKPPGEEESGDDADSSDELF